MEGFLEKSLKIKFALKSAGKLLLGFEKYLIKRKQEPPVIPLPSGSGHGHSIFVVWPLPSMFTQKRVRI